MADFHKPQDGVQDRDDDERQQQHQQRQQMLTEAKEQEKPCKRDTGNQIPIAMHRVCVRDPSRLEAAVRGLFCEGCGELWRMVGP